MPHGPSLKQRLNRASLEKLYKRDGLSTVQIGARYGARPSNVLKLMEEYGIPRRSRRAGKA
jgi:hypothetical protein